MRSVMVWLLVVCVSALVVAGCTEVRVPKGQGLEAGAAGWQVRGSTETRIAAAKQLALDADPASAPALLDALEDEEPIVRRMAIYGLERIGDRRHAPRIVPLLEDEDLWVRRTAATALGKLRCRRAVPALVEALEDEAVLMRLDAFVALGRIGDPAAQQPILEAMRDKRLWTELGLWDQMSVLHVLDRPFVTDPGAVDVLRWLLSYGEWDHPGFADLEPRRRARFTLIIANRAADILATKFGDDAGEAFLVEGLSSDDYMQKASARALAQLGSRRAVPGLIGMLESRWVVNRLCAIEALGAIGDPRAVDALESCLEAEDVGLRRAAAEALERIDGRRRDADLSAPAARLPEIAPAELNTPGGKRPPQFICLGVDDCVNIEGLERMLEIVETLRARDRKVVFTMWVAPLAGDPESRDMVKQKLLLQRLFDLGCEIAHHTLHHNPGGHNWASLPREQQVEEIEGCTEWYRRNIVGFTRPFSHKGGGGGHGRAIDPEFTKQLLARQNWLYTGRRGQHPNEQGWPREVDSIRGDYLVPTGMLDGHAPPVHAEITRPVRSDYPGQFDYEVDRGVAMMKANLDYRYRHPRRPIFAINAFHDWGFKTLDDSTCKWSHRNEAEILKQFLMEVLVREKDKYPEAHCVTFRQVVEYARTGGDLEQTLAIGNGQDVRIPVEPSVR